MCRCKSFAIIRCLEVVVGGEESKTPLAVHLIYVLATVQGRKNPGVRHPLASVIEVQITTTNFPMGKAPKAVVRFEHEAPAVTALMHDHLSNVEHRSPNAPN